MRQACWLMISSFVLALVAVPAWSGERSRNPFGVQDVNNPYGADVRQFAKTVRLSGAANDKNAKQWVSKTTSGKRGSLDGDWFGRWEEGEGVCKIRTHNGKVYVLYTDKLGPYKNVTWLLEAVRESDNRLVGRWVQVGNPRDTGPYVGLIVDDERIDGTWGGGARWDFRRDLGQ